MPQGDKANRTRQVQFRMDPKTLTNLRIAILKDSELHSMADFFNEAAKAYLENSEYYNKMIEQILGGNKNG